MRLSKLLQVIQEKRWNPAEVEVSGIKYDSRQVRRGDLFVAVRGHQVDGHKYIEHAVRNGAVAVVAEQAVEIPAILIQVPDSRKALPRLAAEYHAHPTKRLRLIGITGTNGKTTTSYLTRSILKKAGFQTGLVGTISTVVCDEERVSSLTTPESVELQAAFAEMLECSTTHAVMEVSSHALDLGRVDSCEFDVGVFTNLTQDHLDYHVTMQRYREAKAELFRSLGRSYWQAAKPGPKMGVINADDPAAEFMRDACEVPTIMYGISHKADVSARDIVYNSRGASFVACTPCGELMIDLKLAGRINVYNSLAAIAATHAVGIELDVQKQALELTPGLPGRFERVDVGQAFSVVVDYAHSPDGLRNVISAAREMCVGKVIVVFGCGGDRDRKKRPIMGNIAAELADYVVITSDNPRSEDPDSIIDEIQEGAKQTKSDCCVERERDRKRAIQKALWAASAGDVVLLAGKGHETYQVFRDRTVHFDDREVARELLNQLREEAPARFVTA